MLLTNEVEVGLCGNNIKHYEDLGYIIPRVKNKDGKLVVKRGTKIKVIPQDLTNHSIVTVDVLCDYCLEKGIKTIINKVYSDYFIGKNKDISKDCCGSSECQHKKMNDICFVKYGVNSNSKRYDIKLKIANSQRTKYEDVLKFMNDELNYKLITSEKEYYSHVNSDTDLNFICNIHQEEGVQKSSIYNILYSKRGCSACKSMNIKEVHESQKLDFATVQQDFINSNYTLLETEYINAHTPMRYICNIHKNNGEQTITSNHLRRGEGCRFCMYDNQRGENHFNWQGGITTINNYLRETINVWKRDSLFNGNFLCDITGERKNIILHHTQGFNLIVKEVFNETKLSIHKIIEDYTQDELDLLSKTCLEIHYKYGLGVCLNKDLHKMFHKLYGNKNNTLEQYKDFKSKIISGEILM